MYSTLNACRRPLPRRLLTSSQTTESTIISPKSRTTRQRIDVCYSKPPPFTQDKRHFPMENPTTPAVMTTIMKEHDPNEDPFADLVDDSQNQMVSPLEYGSGAVSPPKQQQSQPQQGGDDDVNKEETNVQVASGDDQQHSN